MRYPYVWGGVVEYGPGEEPTVLDAGAGRLGRSDDMDKLSCLLARLDCPEGLWVCYVARVWG